eukprot:6950994-Pyramimonas_sp.AAC.1
MRVSRLAGCKLWLLAAFQTGCASRGGAKTIRLVQVTVQLSTEVKERSQGGARQRCFFNESALYDPVLVERLQSAM